MSIRQHLEVWGRYMAINCPVVCLQYIIYYPMTDDQIILRDIECQTDHQCPLRAICTYSILHYNILLFHISFGFSRSDE